MAGYLINLGTAASLKQCIDNGIYATILSSPKGFWGINHEGTCCDYATMKATDNIYFFIERKIYGIGELIDINGACKYLNFPTANQPQNFNYSTIKSDLLIDTGLQSANQRWLCLFKPSPFFFSLGIDIDDLLTSNPTAFKMVRALWKLSFIKIDDNENQAFKDAILKLNEKSLLNPNNTNTFTSNYHNVHATLAPRITTQHHFQVKEILHHAQDGIKFKHEMALELGLVYQLHNAGAFTNTQEIFGSWDYISHQVVASPFKPIDYMDKMDIFGYSYVKGFKPTKSKFLVIELKKGPCLKEDVEQLLNYVDWINEEYAFKDYSMIRAFLVGASIDTSVRDYAKLMGNRKFTVGKRPAQSKEWLDLNLVQYSYDPVSQHINFQLIP